MKANAPEKIYISTNSQDGTYYISNQYKKLIQYIRTDAFIEKACEFLNEYIYEIEQYDPLVSDYVIIQVYCKHHDSKEDFIEDFKKYMEDKA